MPKRKYRVFISHGSDDLWVAEQIAGSIETYLGALSKPAR